MDKFQNSPSIVTSKDTKTGGGINLGGKKNKPNRAGPLVHNPKSYQSKSTTQKPKKPKAAKTATKESKKRDTSNEEVYIESSAPKEASVSKPITRQTDEKEILDTFQNKNMISKEWEALTNQVLTRGVQKEAEKLLNQQAGPVDTCPPTGFSDESDKEEEETTVRRSNRQTVSRWFGPCSGGEARTCGFSQIAKFKPGGGEEFDSVFSLGHTVGRYFTRQQLTHGVADHGGKLQAINIPANRKRHVEVMARMKMCHDVEVNPGPAKSKLRCTICNEGFKKKEWSVKCNGCKKWTHWNCTSLGEDGRWSTSFRAQCCTPQEPHADDGQTETVEQPTVESNEHVDQLQRNAKKRVKKRAQKQRGRQKRQEKRDEKWTENAKRMGKKKQTSIWTWNIQRARVAFPRRSRFAEMLREVAKSHAEVVLFTELCETVEGIKWIKAGDLYGVLIHGKKSGVFLRDLWAVDWKEQGYKRQCGDRNTAVDVSGVRFVATYQPLWEGQTDDFARYREELEDMLITLNLLVIGGDFNSSVGDTRERSRDTVAGKFGLGKTNTAGVDLIEWCHANQLA